MNPSPPKYILRFLRWFCHPDLLPSIEGDLMELYQERLANRGRRKANWLFTWDVVKLFRPSIIRSARGTYRMNFYGLLRHNAMVARRNLLRQKAYTLINILGLALGFSSCLLISLFIRDELSYDNFHQDGDRIYRVASAFMKQGEWQPYSVISWPATENIKTSFGEMQESVRIRTRKDIFSFKEKRFSENRVASVSDNFFEFFSFPLISGNPNDVLKGSNKVVISQSIAKKYFGRTDVLGEIFEVSQGELAQLLPEPFQLQVSGVMEDMPSNSHFHFDFLISGQTSRQIAPSWMYTNMGWPTQYFYIKINEGVDPAVMESDFPEFIDNHITQFNSENLKLFLQPLTDIHLRSNNDLEIEANGNSNHVYIFSVIAFFILIIACVNYMNLTTARSLRRAKEVGMRKVLGVKKIGLISQFLTESFVMTFVAALIAFGLTFLLLSEFNQFAGKDISRMILFDSETLVTLLITLVVVSLFSGAYPSFVLSAFKPLNALKGGQPSDKSGMMLRKGLVVLQFVISIVLIAATAIVFKQLDFLRNKELGINKELLMAVPLQTIDRTRLDVFKSELLNNPSILNASVSDMEMPGFINHWTYYKAQDVPVSEQVSITSTVLTVDHDFFATVGAEIVRGRDFSKDLDVTTGFPSSIASSLVLNESAVKQLGWEDPIDKWIEFDDRRGERFHVVGVVKDFHFGSLHEKIPPIIFYIRVDPFLDWAYVRIDDQNIPSTIEHIERVYSEFVPDRNFSYSFLDEDIHRQYQTDEKFTEIITLFAALAIILASLGTFGLISFSAERKSKEIGIRKVLGATVGNITLMLIKEFVMLLMLASLIAWPITYYFTNGWIENFAYRTNIGFDAFALATCLALLIAMGTTGFRAIKAAMANPVDSLSDE